MPITPQRYPRVLFYTVEPPAGGEGNYQVQPACAKVKSLLEAEGFQIDEFVPQPYGEGFTTKYEAILKEYDLILYVANLSTKSNQTVVRIEWKQPMPRVSEKTLQTVIRKTRFIATGFSLIIKVNTVISCY